MADGKIISDNSASDNVPEFRIFISSPGDVAPERMLAKNIISELQRQYAGRVILRAILWEEYAQSAAVSFQAGIEMKLGGSIDLAIFILSMIRPALGAPSS